VKVFRVVLVLFFSGCAGGPAPPDWQLNAVGALKNFQHHYLVGDTKTAEMDFAAAKAELARTGRADLLARAELIRCAVRTASLEFDDCPGFERLRAGAGAEEVAYWNYLTGGGQRTISDDPLSMLVTAGVLFRTGRIAPGQISAAADIASAQGWRRPLLAWLGVQARRAEEAGDKDAAARIRGRIELILQRP
jgi:hypothetical protein